MKNIAVFKMSQFKLHPLKDGSTSACLIYFENYSKNNQGGLLHRKVKPKSVTNDSDPQRCLVCLFQTYLRHRPHDNPNFYLTPLRQPKGDIWYSNVPVGHNTLSRTVARLCKSAGIPGYKTNHSLRVTCATRLFQKLMMFIQVIAVWMVFDRTNELVMSKGRPYPTCFIRRVRIKKI